MGWMVLDDDPEVSICSYSAIRRHAARENGRESHEKWQSQDLNPCCDDIITMSVF